MSEINTINEICQHKCIITYDILLNYINDYANHDILYTLNETVWQYLSQYKTVSNLIIILNGHEIYSFRPFEANLYISYEKYKCKINDNKIVIIVQHSQRIQGPKFTVIYDVTGIDAERSPAVIDLTNIIFTKQGLTVNDRDVIFIGITKNPITDLPLFKDSTSRGYNVYISALGTGNVTYLADLYFDTAILGIYHVNCFSTSVTLSGRPNLIRVFPSDNFNPPIFVKLSTNDIIIVYGLISIWANSLKNGIKTLARAQGKNVISIPATVNSTSYIDVLATLPSSVNKHSLIILSDYTMEIIDNIRISGVLDNKFEYDIFFGDAAVNVPVTSPELLVYLQQHNTLLIQPFLTDREISLSRVLNAELNNPVHPVSQNVIFFYTCIDVAILLANMTLPNRLKRRKYVRFEIDDKGENLDGYYSGIQYTGWETYNLYMIIFVNKDELFIGIAE